MRERPRLRQERDGADLSSRCPFTGGEVVERDPALCVKRGVGFSGFRHVCMVMPPIKRDEELVRQANLTKCREYLLSMQVPDQR